MVAYHLERWSCFILPVTYLLFLVVYGIAYLPAEADISEKGLTFKPITWIFDDNMTDFGVWN